MSEIIDAARTIAAAAEANLREEPSVTAETRRRGSRGWTGTMTALARFAIVTLTLAATAGGAWRLFQFVAGV